MTAPPVRSITALAVADSRKLALETDMYDLTKYGVSGFLMMVTLFSACWSVAEGIVDVERELYVKHTVPGAGRWVNGYYVGTDLERVEIHTFMAKSDTPEKPKRRRSKDNGRTWSEFSELSEVVSHERGARIYWGEGPRYHDAAHDVTVSIWLRQTKQKLYANHSFSRLSRDRGRTWGEPTQLRYEDGTAFDLGNPLDPAYINNNQSYFGNNIILHSNGTLIHVGRGGQCATLKSGR